MARFNPYTVMETNYMQASQQSCNFDLRDVPSSSIPKPTLVAGEDPGLFVVPIRICGVI